MPVLRLARTPPLHLYLLARMTRSGLEWQIARQVSHNNSHHLELLSNKYTPATFSKESQSDALLSN
jgi:hypothetical protein